MKINIDFIFTCESDDWKIEKLVWRLAQKLKNYQTGETWIFKRVYRIEQDDKLYHEVVETYEKYKTEINFKILDFNVELNEEEVKEAVAFIPIWPNEFCEEYDDVSYKYKQCDLCGSSLKSDDIIFVQPVGSIKKDGFKILSFDGLNEIVMLPKLVDKLLEEGVCEEHFQPVFSKKKKIMGYIFEKENVMPLGSYIDPNYKKTMICEKCNAHCYHTNQDVNYIRKKWLKKDIVQMLKDVNCTSEYYDGHRVLLISPKIQKIISKYVKDSAFIPVFESEEVEYDMEKTTRII